MPDFTLHRGDCLETMRGMADNSVDSIVTDPPYGLSFMGKKWDYDVPAVEVWAECLRVLKPGGYLLAFAGTRTQHRMAVRIEDAGFEIRDMIAWVYASGFPKSHNLQGDKQGWGTALKPALEPITVARKPLVGTVAANVLEHGTGALNIDGCRVEAPDGVPLFTSRNEPNGKTMGDGLNGSNRTGEVGTGRWPANLIHDGSDEVLAGFPQSNHKTGGSFKATGAFPIASIPVRYDDTGSAARFFYCPKASKQDRDDGLNGFAQVKVKTKSGGGAPNEGRAGSSDGGIRANTHPTVKPSDLMAYLVRLVTPPGGVVLDPFMGSGSTGKAAMREGFDFIGCELDDGYIEIARARIEHERVQGVAQAAAPLNRDLFTEAA